MTMTGTVVDFLKRQRVPFLPVRHPLGYTAQHEAAAAHVQGRHWAKTVVCVADDRPVQAVLPAHMMVDLDRLQALLEARTIRIATEPEIAAMYPNCELGAMPPFGSLYGQQVVVDATLVGDPHMVFNAGSHTEAVCMHYNDFAQIVKPMTGSIARRAES
jgi:Ala-tRNA(Pro) deacylase